MGTAKERKTPQVSFDERVRTAMISCAQDYQKYFVNYEYLLCSEAFHCKDYYIVAALPGNFLHLTGVSTYLSATDFFEKCLNGTLELSDFSYFRWDQTEKVVKGSVRRKIQVLPDIKYIFSPDALVEENFRRNTILCSFAADRNCCTMGFTLSDKTRPKTLLKGPSLHKNACKIDILLRGKANADKFDEILFYNPSTIGKYRDSIKDVLDKSLYETFGISSEGD